MKNSKHGDKFNWFNYVVLNNQWGRSSAENNSYQYIEENDNNSLIFSYRWEGNSDMIKSFPAICSGWHFGNPGGWLTEKHNNRLPAKLALNKSLHTSLSVSHENKGTLSEVMNLSWDIWLSDSVNPEIPAGEIMVWPWRVNQVPIGKLFSIVSYWGYDWEVYTGKSCYKEKCWPVVSFICKKPTLNINGNLIDFTKYCLNKRFFTSNYYVLGIELGNEILTGEGAFKYEYYNLDFEVN